MSTGLLMRVAAGAAVVLLAAAGCGGGDDDSGGSAGTQDLKGQTINVAAVWTGAEQAKFKKVMKAFSDQTGAKVNFIATGDSVSTFLDSKLQGGQPPDVAS